MDATERALKNNKKIARALIRLKHSIRADNEIDDYMEEGKKLLTQGMLPSIEIAVGDLTGDAP